MSCHVHCAWSCRVVWWWLLLFTYFHLVISWEDVVAWWRDWCCCRWWDCLIGCLPTAMNTSERVVKQNEINRPGLLIVNLVISHNCHNPILMNYDLNLLFRRLQNFCHVENCTWMSSCRKMQTLNVTQFLDIIVTIIIIMKSGAVQRFVRNLPKNYKQFRVYTSCGVWTSQIDMLHSMVTLSSWEKKK